MNSDSQTGSHLPTTISRYEIKERIGRGGMATVYLAYDPSFKREVAIKLMPPELVSDATLHARFEREARTIATLEHRSIVPVYDFGEQDGQPYLVMRYMPHGTLADVIREGAISLDDAGTHLRRLGAALDHVHSHGVVHRDLKPTNIMFDQYGESYLADFGIVRVTGSTTNLTGTGIVGTPAYMSPEQVRGDETIDHRSDIYALGVILFEMLTGMLPYQSDTPVGVAMMHITDPLPQIHMLNPALPPSTQDVINRSMAKERDDRYPNALALASAVTNLANSAAREKTSQTAIKTSAPPATLLEPQLESPPTLLGSQAPLTPPPVQTYAPPESEQPEQQRKRSPWLWIGLGLLLLLIIGGVGAAAGFVGFASLFGNDTAPAVQETVIPPTEVEAEPNEEEIIDDGPLPEVQLIDPQPGSQLEVEVGGDPVMIRFVATAIGGISRVDLKVNGGLADALPGEPENSTLASEFEWSPAAAGPYLLTLETVAKDGSVSTAASFTVNAVDAAEESTATPTEEEASPTPTESGDDATATPTPSSGSGGSGGSATSGERSIEGTYTSSATAVNSGESVTLSWDLNSSGDFIFSLELWEFAEGATQPVKNEIVQAVKAHAGSRAFTLTSTTTYRLDAYFNDENENQTVQQRSITVTIGQGGSSSGSSGSSAGSSGGSSGGPIIFRDPPVVSLVSATRINDAGDAALTLSVEFRGGSPSFTLSGDGIGVPQAHGITGSFSSGGSDWSFIHFQASGKCGGGFPASITVTDSSGQTVSYSYFISSVPCS